MFYDTFAIIYKAYDYKLVFLFDLLTTRIIFFDQSLKWTRRQNVYFFQNILYSVPPHNLCGYLNNFSMQYVRYYNKIIIV